MSNIAIFLPRQYKETFIFSKIIETSYSIEYILYARDTLYTIRYRY